jgi:hypothetical protein
LKPLALLKDAQERGKDLVVPDKGRRMIQHAIEECSEDLDLRMKHTFELRDPPVNFLPFTLTLHA